MSASSPISPSSNVGWAAAVAQAQARWERFRAGPLGRGGLVRVHAGNKYLLMAASPTHYRALGRIVAAPATMSTDEQVARYHAGFVDALARSPAAGAHVNVLQHLAGYFKKRLARTERAAIAAAIAEFGAGRAALEHPLTLIAQHARALKIDYLLDQSYLGAAAGDTT